MVSIVATPSGGMAQAPDTVSPAGRQLPRFTLRAMIQARNDSAMRIPGSWLRAATSAFPESSAVQAYLAAASRIPIDPLEPPTLASERSQHVMGLYRRAELVQASRRTLEAIRAAIPDDSTRVRFDAIFRPQGEWIVDLHDAALAWARARRPGIRWSDAWRALAAAHWIDPRDSAAGEEAFPRALYALAALATTDSADYAATRQTLWRADSASAGKVFTLLQGYAESKEWYVRALGFFLTQPWLPDHGGSSIQDLVAESWRGVLEPPADLVVPVIAPQWFGYPQAVPTYGVPPRLFARLVRLDNKEAARWLNQYGQRGFLRSVGRLPQGDSTPVLLRTGSETLRLTTTARHAKESLNGFLEPTDGIAIDPGYSPLLALGAVVHEWQHLMFRRQQLDRLAAEMRKATPSVIPLPGIEPHIAEGFAEWSAERILEPVAQRWPLLGLGEVEKRAALAQSGTDDEHTLGYALVRSLASTLGDPSATTKLLLKYADAPQRLLREPALRKAWKRYNGGSDLAVRRTGPRTLLPEVTFTIEDGQPDVITTRILLPGRE